MNLWTAFKPLWALLLLSMPWHSSPRLSAEVPDYLVIITLDGVRTTELFGGLDRDTYKAASKSAEWADEATYQSYWAETPQARREKLMPFFWGEWMSQHGSVIGNRALGSQMDLRNRHRFSYPGYSEILTGQARDQQIKSNDKIQSPAPTLLEFLKKEWQLPRAQVGVFSSWDTIRYIVEQEAGSLFINSGFEPYQSDDAVIESFSLLQRETTTPWNSVRHDAYTFAFCQHYIDQQSPRVLYLALGETDDWAHDVRYDRVLESLHRSDRYLRALWEQYQSNPKTRGNTCFVMTTDHGRGDNPFNWMHHNDKLDGAKQTWMAVVSPSLAARGEWHAHPQAYSDQVAATSAKLVGVDYQLHDPMAGIPMEWLFR